MLEATILDQVRSIFQPLEARYTFHITCNPEHEQAGEKPMSPNWSLRS